MHALRDENGGLAARAVLGLIGQTATIGLSSWQDAAGYAGRVKLPQRASDERKGNLGNLIAV